jgi:mannose-6-phosphate isomerase
MLYPLVFVPRLKPRLWGGRSLATLYGKPLPPGEPVGESWEISDRPGDESLIANGPLAGRSLRWLLEQHGPALLGAATAPNGRFPLLVKILDAREILSVQVHPPAHLAAQLGGEPKSELWYVTHAGREAALSAGLKAQVTRAEFEQRLRDGTVAECIHQVPVQRGDALFLPSGRIHALGADLVIFEIQQNSDTTYRVFDWNRVGPDGQPRELHLEPALACIDFADFEPDPIQAAWQEDGPQQRRSLLDDPLFSVTEHRATAAAGRLGSGERVQVLGVVSGAVQLDHPASGERLVLQPGQFALLPAITQPVPWSVTAASSWLVATPGTLT